MSSNTYSSFIIMLPISLLINFCSYFSCSSISLSLILPCCTLIICYAFVSFWESSYGLFFWSYWCFLPYLQLYLWNLLSLHVAMLVIKRLYLISQMIFLSKFPCCLIFLEWKSQLLSWESYYLLLLLSCTN